MTPEPPVLLDLADAIAHHRLAFEAAEDPTTAPALAELLESGRALAAMDLGERLLEGVRAWLAAAGVLEDEHQTPYLEALADAIALRDEDDFEASDADSYDEPIAEMPDVSSWFISPRDLLEPIH